MKFGLYNATRGGFMSFDCKQLPKMTGPSLYDSLAEANEATEMATKLMGGDEIIAMPVEDLPWKDAADNYVDIANPPSMEAVIKLQGDRAD
jgi:hypothetical protein